MIEVDIRFERQAATVPFEEPLELRDFQRMKLNHLKCALRTRYRLSVVGYKDLFSDNREPTTGNAPQRGALLRTRRNYRVSSCSAANASLSREICRYATAAG